MKIGMKEEMGVADKMTSSFLDCERACAFAHKKRANLFVFLAWGEKKELELS